MMQFHTKRIDPHLAHVLVDDCEFFWWYTKSYSQWLSVKPRYFEARGVTGVASIVREEMSRREAGLSLVGRRLIQACEDWGEDLSDLAIYLRSFGATPAGTIETIYRRAAVASARVNRDEKTALLPGVNEQAARRCRGLSDYLLRDLVEVIDQMPAAYSHVRNGGRFLKRRSAELQIDSLLNAARACIEKASVHNVAARSLNAFFNGGNRDAWIGAVGELTGLRAAILRRAGLAPGPVQTGYEEFGLKPVTVDLAIERLRSVRGGPWLPAEEIERRCGVTAATLRQRKLRGQIRAHKYNSITGKKVVAQGERFCRNYYSLSDVLKFYPEQH